jgi:hypothetical protein
MPRCAYTRSSNSGSGVVGGAISNSVTFSTSRTFDRVWLCALTSAYTPEFRAALGHQCCLYL